MSGLRKELSFNYNSRSNGNHYDEESKYSENQNAKEFKEESFAS